ncbi:Kanadaptin [Modicella reniformis]|uniref:Kanadaptin n=1 Tax=Modicella reniformis TaxID=1440133 RepID=A0A9P6JFP8_9FUNG|nr:Kanadaptin [Modicella reniformis]
MSTSNGNNAATAVSVDTSAEKTTQESKESKPVFAVPAVPVKKSAAMAPPPPPLFPKEQRRAPAPPSIKERSDTEKASPSPPDSKSVSPNAPPLKYQKPAWSGYPNQQFYFEVIKNGIIVEKIKAPLKEFLTIGRLPMCDLEMAHPVKRSFLLHGLHV